VIVTSVPIVGRYLGSMWAVPMEVPTTETQPVLVSAPFMENRGSLALSVTETLGSFFIQLNTIHMTYLFVGNVSISVLCVCMSVIPLRPTSQRLN
jgi:hypothetical protein